MAKRPEDSLYLATDSLYMPSESMYLPPGTPTPPSHNPQYSLANLDDPLLDDYEKSLDTIKYLKSDRDRAKENSDYYETERTDYVKDKLFPFYEEALGGFAESGAYKDEDKMLTALEEERAFDTSSAGEEPGFFGGVSDTSKDAAGRLETLWPRFDSIKNELSKRTTNDESSTTRYDLMERSYLDATSHMSRVPIAFRQALDEQSDLRGDITPTILQESALLDSMEFEEPIYDAKTGKLANRDRVDPRKAEEDPRLRTSMSARKMVQQRQIQEFLTKRSAIYKDRRYRDVHEAFTSINGYQDGYPIGVSREEVDILDADKAMKMGLETYNGKPIAQAFADLGGEERLQVAKLMDALFAAEKAKAESQFQFISTMGKPGTNDKKQTMDAMNQAYHRIYDEVKQAGFEEEVLQRAVSTHTWTGMVDSSRKGYMQSELAELWLDFGYGKADESAIERFIEVATEMENIPETSAMKEFREKDVEDGWEVLGYLFFENPKAMVDMAVESFSAFIPAYFNTALEVGGGGAALGAAAGKWRGFKGGGKAGAIAGAGSALTANWAVASYSLEFTGSIMESMNELNIDWKNPKMFAAAWGNPYVVDKIRTKAMKKGLPIAFFDLVSAGISGKVGAILRNPTKILNKKALNKAAKSTPRFTLPQRMGNALTEYMADAGLGMTGEALGQIWSSDPGTPLDWKAIIAEGVVGMGPAGARAVYDLVGPAVPGLKDKPYFRDFSESNIDLSAEKPHVVNGVEVGTAVGVSRAGWKKTAHGFTAADSMTAHLLTGANIAPDSEKGMATQDFWARTYRYNPAEAAKIRVVMADRTPDGNPENPGMYEYDSKSDIHLIYLNTNKFNMDPIAAMMHESGHFARFMMFSQGEVGAFYDQLEPEEKLDHWARYRTGTNQKFGQLGPDEQERISKSYESVSKTRRVEEWFAYQWTRVVSGITGERDPNLHPRLQSFLKDHIHPWLDRWIGDEEASLSEKRKEFDQRILQAMGYTPDGRVDYSSPNIRAPAGAMPPGMEELPFQEGLNTLYDRYNALDNVAKERADRVMEVIMGPDWKESLGPAYLTAGETAVATRKDKTQLVQEISDFWVKSLIGNFPDATPEQLNTIVEEALTGARDAYGAVRPITQDVSRPSGAELPPTLPVLKEGPFKGDVDPEVMGRTGRGRLTRETETPPAEAATEMPTDTAQLGPPTMEEMATVKVAVETTTGEIESLEFVTSFDAIEEYMLITSLEREMGVGQVKEGEEGYRAFLTGPYDTGREEGPFETAEEAEAAVGEFRKANLEKMMRSYAELEEARKLAKLSEPEYKKAIDDIVDRLAESLGREPTLTEINELLVDPETLREVSALGAAREEDLAKKTGLREFTEDIVKDASEEVKQRLNEFRETVKAYEGMLERRVSEAEEASEFIRLKREYPGEEFAELEGKVSKQLAKGEVASLEELLGRELTAEEAASLQRAPSKGELVARMKKDRGAVPKGRVGAPKVAEAAKAEKAEGADKDLVAWAKRNKSWLTAANAGFIGQVKEGDKWVFGVFRRKKGKTTAPDGHYYHQTGEKKVSSNYVKVEKGYVKATKARFVTGERRGAMATANMLAVQAVLPAEKAKPAEKKAEKVEVKGEQRVVMLDSFVDALGAIASESGVENLGAHVRGSKTEMARLKDTLLEHEGETLHSPAFLDAFLSFLGEVEPFEGTMMSTPRDVIDKLLTGPKGGLLKTQLSKPKLNEKVPGDHEYVAYNARLNKLRSSLDSWVGDWMKTYTATKRRGMGISEKDRRAALTRAMRGGRLKEAAPELPGEVEELKRLKGVVDVSKAKLTKLEKLDIAVSPETYRDIWADTPVTWALFKNTYLRIGEDNYRRLTLRDLAYDRTGIGNLYKKTSRRSVTDATNLKDSDFKYTPRKTEAKTDAAKTATAVEAEADTVVYFTKNQSYLSNFALVLVDGEEGKFKYKGKEFKTVEGAYQAFKSGKYFAGYNDLDGAAARNKAQKDTKNKVDTGKSRGLMLDLLKERYEQDARFKKELDEAGAISHPVGVADPKKNYWRYELPKILYEVRDFGPEPGVKGNIPLTYESGQKIGKATLDFREEHLKAGHKNMMDLAEAGKIKGITRKKAETDKYKEGDVVKLVGAKGDERELYARVTGPAVAVRDVKAEEWSKKEGWTEEQHEYWLANDGYQIPVETVEKPKPEPAPVVEEEVAPAINILSHTAGGYKESAKINAQRAATTIIVSLDTESGEAKSAAKVVSDAKKKQIPLEVDASLEVTDSIVDSVADQIRGSSLNIVGDGIYSFAGTDVSQEQVDAFMLELLQKVQDKLDNKITTLRSSGQTGMAEAGAKAGSAMGLDVKVLAPKGWLFRVSVEDERFADAEGVVNKTKVVKDIADEDMFKARFEEEKPEAEKVKPEAEEAVPEAEEEVEEEEEVVEDLEAEEAAAEEEATKASEKEGLRRNRNIKGHKALQDMVFGIHTQEMEHEKWLVATKGVEKPKGRPKRAKYDPEAFTAENRKKKDPESGLTPYDVRYMLNAAWASARQGESIRFYKSATGGVEYETHVFMTEEGTSPYAVVANRLNEYHKESMRKGEGRLSRVERGIPKTEAELLALEIAGVEELMHLYVGDRYAPQGEEGPGAGSFVDIRLVRALVAKLANLEQSKQLLDKEIAEAAPGADTTAAKNLVKEIEKAYEALEMKFVTGEFDWYSKRRAELGPVEEEAARYVQDEKTTGRDKNLQERINEQKAIFIYAANIARRKLENLHAEEVDIPKGMSLEGEVGEGPMAGEGKYRHIVGGFYSGENLMSGSIADIYDNDADVRKTVEGLDISEDNKQATESTTWKKSGEREQLRASVAFNTPEPAPLDPDHPRYGESTDEEGTPYYQYVPRGDLLGDTIKHPAGVEFERSVVDEAVSVVHALIKTAQEQGLDPKTDVKTEREYHAVKENMMTEAELKLKKGETLVVKGDINLEKRYWHSKKGFYMTEEAIAEAIKFAEDWGASREEIFASMDRDGETLIEDFEVTFSGSRKRTYTFDGAKWTRRGETTSDAMQSVLMNMWADKQEAAHREWMHSEDGRYVTMAGLVQSLFPGGKAADFKGLEYLAQMGAQERGGPAYGMLMSISLEHILDKMITKLGLDPSEFMPEGAVHEKIKSELLKARGSTRGPKVMFKALKMATVAAKMKPIVDAVIAAERLDLHNQRHEVEAADQQTVVARDFTGMDVDEYEGPGDVAEAEEKEAFGAKAVEENALGEREDLSKEVGEDTKKIFGDVAPEHKASDKEDVVMEGGIHELAFAESAEDPGSVLASRDPHPESRLHRKYAAIMWFATDDSGADRIDYVVDALARGEKPRGVHGLVKAARLMVAFEDNERYAEAGPQAVHKKLKSWVARAKTEPEGLKAEFRQGLEKAKRHYSTRPQDLQLFGSMSASAGRYARLTAEMASKTFDQIVSGPAASREEGSKKRASYLVKHQLIKSEMDVYNRRSSINERPRPEFNKHVREELKRLRPKNARDALKILTKYNGPAGLTNTESMIISMARVVLSKAGRHLKEHDLILINDPDATIGLMSKGERWIKLNLYEMEEHHTTYRWDIGVALLHETIHAAFDGALGELFDRGNIYDQIAREHGSSLIPHERSMVMEVTGERYLEVLKKRALTLDKSHPGRKLVAAYLKALEAMGEGFEGVEGYYDLETMKSRKESFKQGKFYIENWMIGLQAPPLHSYPLFNLEEFIAFAFSDNEFQKVLAQLPALEGSKASNLWADWISIISEFLGFKGTRHENLGLLSDVLHAGVGVLDADKPLEWGGEGSFNPQTQTISDPPVGKEADGGESDLMQRIRRLAEAAGFAEEFEDMRKNQPLGAKYAPEDQLGMVELMRDVFLPTRIGVTQSPEQWSKDMNAPALNKSGMGGLSEYAKDVGLLKWLDLHEQGEMVSTEDILKYLDDHAPALAIEIREAREGSEPVDWNERPVGFATSWMFTRSLSEAEINNSVGVEEGGEDPPPPQVMIARRKGGSDSPGGPDYPGMPAEVRQRGAHQSWIPEKDVFFYATFQETEHAVSLIELQSDWLQQSKSEIKDFPPLQKRWIQAAVASLMRYAAEKNKQLVLPAHARGATGERENRLYAKEIPKAVRYLSQHIAGSPNALDLAAPETKAYMDAADFTKVGPAQKKIEVRLEANHTHEMPPHIPQEQLVHTQDDFVTRVPVTHRLETLPKHHVGLTVTAKMETDGWAYYSVGVSVLNAETYDKAINHAPGQAGSAVTHPREGAAKEFKDKLKIEFNWMHNERNWAKTRGSEPTSDYAAARKLGLGMANAGSWEREETYSRSIYGFFSAADRYTEEHGIPIPVITVTYDGVPLKLHHLKHRQGTPVTVRSMRGFVKSASYSGAKLNVVDMRKTGEDDMNRVSLYGVVSKKDWEAAKENTAFGGKFTPYEGPLTGVMGSPKSFLGAKMGEKWDKATKKWGDEQVGWQGRLARNFMDQNIPMEHLQNNFIGLLGIDKTHDKYDSLASHVKAGIMYGVGHAEMEEMELRYVQPVRDAMIRHGVTNERWGRYLIARTVPGVNIHVAKKRARAFDRASDENKERWKPLVDENGNPNGSGRTTAWALSEVRKMEADPKMRAFLSDKNNPLKVFYEMNKSDLDKRVATGLVPEGDRTAMTKAASEFNWRGKSDFATEDSYAYAPLIGFEGETDTIFEEEELFDVFFGGKNIAGAGQGGQGLDQSKSRLLTKGRFGRQTMANPELVFPAAVQQVAGGMMRGQRNEVAQSIGYTFESMREVINEGTFDGQKVDADVVDRVKMEYAELFAIPPDKDLESVMETAYDTRVDSEGHPDAAMPLKIKTLNPEFATDPFVFTYRSDGVAKMIKFNRNARGADLVTALNNMRYQPLKNPIAKVANVFSKFVSQMVTAWNFSFVVGNFVRDYITAKINLSEDDKKRFVKTALSPKSILHFMKGIWRAERLKSKGQLPSHLSTSALQKMSVAEARKDPVTAYLFAKAHGAKVGMFRHNTIPDIVRDMDKAFRNDTWAQTEKGIKKVFKPVADFVENANAAVENSIRISSFWAAIDAGMTVQQAADVSRNSTVDFNRKGYYTQQLNAFYMFFGASMASMHRMHKAIMRRGGYGSSKALLLYGQIAALGATMNVLSRILTADDEDEGEEPFMDRVSPYLRDTHMHLPIPGFMTYDGNPRSFTMPFALGWNVFWAIGQNSMDVAVNIVSDKGGQGPMQASARMLTAMEGSFNPIGGGGSFLTMLAPTAITPVVEISTNQNFMGYKIVNEDREYALPKPAYLKDKDKTSPHFTSLSEGLNSLLGGDATTPGNWLFPLGVDPLDPDNELTRMDLSGAEVEHFLRGYLGGPFDVASMFLSGGNAVVKDGEFYMEKVPGIRRFYRGEPGNYGIWNRYDGLRERVLLSHKGLEGLVASKDTTAVREYKKEYLGLLKLKNVSETVDKQLNTLRRLKTKVLGSKISGSKKKQQLDKLEKDRLNAMLKLLSSAEKLKVST